MGKDTDFALTTTMFLISVPVIIALGLLQTTLKTVLYSNLLFGLTSSETTNEYWMLWEPINKR